MVVLVDAFWNAPSIFWHLLATFRRQRKLPPGFTEPLGPDKMQILEIMLPQGSPYAKGVNQGFKKETITLYWDLSGQHTVTWKTEVTCLVNGQSTTLKPGSANLYTFPRVTWRTPRLNGKKDWFCTVNEAFEASKAASEELIGNELEVLKALFVAIASDPREREALRLPDWSGANCPLAMLVANNKAAIDVCVEIYTIWPELLAQAHLPGFFIGENALHVLAVNRQEDALCDLLYMAESKLSRALLKDCITSQAVGAFFWGKPMNTYGGTPIAYAASFCMKRAVAVYLKLGASDKMRGFVGLNEAEHQCKLTGFAPLHAVVANGYDAMYDFLADLPIMDQLSGGEALLYVLLICFYFISKYNIKILESQTKVIHFPNILRNFRILLVVLCLTLQ